MSIPSSGKSLTEHEWLTSSNLPRMVRLLRGRLSGRKWRLFACAWCRRNWASLSDPRSRKAVEVAERFADGLCGEPERARALKEALAASVLAASNGAPRRSVAACAWADSAVSVNALRACLNTWEMLPTGENDFKAQADLLREIAGNPFREVPFDARRCTSRVTALAQRIYDKQSFGELPALAAAFERAGCCGDELLDHFRSSQAHARGCWGLDLVLGKQ